MEHEHPILEFDPDVNRPAPGRPDPGGLATAGRDGQTPPMAIETGPGGLAVRRVVMLGPPASGKGTQGKRLAALIGAPHVSTGALLRRSIDDGDPSGVAALVDDGRRVPDDVVDTVLAPALGEAFVLDGYPRTPRQAERLDQLLDGRPLERAVELTLDEATLCARMFLRAEYEHRGDDSPEVFLRRLEDYQREAPAIRRHYGERLAIVDSSGDEDEVFDRMLRALGLEAVPV
jgi:adenylate kinase